MKTVKVGLLLGVVAGGLIAMALMPKPHDQPQPNSEWCFHSEYDSLKHYDQTAPPAEKVFVRLNGVKVEVLVPCSALVYP